MAITIPGDVRDVLLVLCPAYCLFAQINQINVLSIIQEAGLESRRFSIPWLGNKPGQHSC